MTFTSFPQLSTRDGSSDILNVVHTKMIFPKHKKLMCIIEKVTKLMKE